MKLVGSNPHAKVSGLEELPGKSNYFIGNDPKKWRTNVPNYAKVKYASVYPGVDLVYYGNQGKLEYDFVVEPGADPHSIQLAIVSDEQAGSRQKAAGSEIESQSAIANRKSSMAAPLRIDTNGDLVVGTDGGEVIFHKPVVYQPEEDRPSSVVSRASRSATDNGPMTKDGGRHYVDGRYVAGGNNSVAFRVSSYDPAKPLVIDPVLAYSTYLGGTGGDSGNAIVVDASGNAFVTGWTDSFNFPTTAGAFQATLGGDYNNAFVSKLNTAGSALLYSTYLGGSGGDSGTSGTGIAIDASGNAYVTGQTGSTDFPTTPGAFQTTHPGGFSSSHGFVTKLNATGSALLYSTYLGGTQNDNGAGVAVDTSGNAYVTGTTSSSDFPVTAGAFQTTFDSQASFVTKLNVTGSALLYSTYLGGPNANAYGIAVDASRSAYVTGSYGGGFSFPTTPGAFRTNCITACAFVSKLNSGGSALAYSTYLGETYFGGVGGGIAVDAAGNAYITGIVLPSSAFPTTPGAFQTTSGECTYGSECEDAFVSKLNPTGSALVYATYLGGSFGAVSAAIAVDTSGNAYVTGLTGSSDFPTTADAFQSAYRGNPDAFVTKLNAAGSALVYSTYLGGSKANNGTGIALDASGNTYVTGLTTSSDFPTTAGVFQITYAGGYGDAFISKFTFVPAPGLALNPSRLTFTPQALGTTSAAQKVRLSNDGTLPLSLSSIAGSGDFAQTNDCPLNPNTVAPGGFCTLSVTFTPTATGIRIGAVTITDNAAGSPHQLPLTGTGGIPLVSLTPASLTFSSQAVGTTSPTQPATLKNTGDGPLNITSVVASGDFAQTNNCASTLNAAASCALSVTFTPTATGTRTGAITITDNAPGSPHHLSLAGTGATGVTLTPTSLTFASQSVGTFSSSQLATLKNVGGTMLKILSIGRSGDFYEGNNCPSSLAAGASCTLRVIFTPTSPGAKSSAVTIVDNAPGSPHKLPLSGTGSGTGSIVLKLSPPSLIFGSVAVGASSASQTVTLTNTGTAAASFLEPFGFATSGTNWNDFHKDPHCGTNLAPGKSCTVSVFFKPLAKGTRTGFFLVRQGAASVSIPLSGTGQ
jgi:hypothetical protein